MALSVLVSETLCSLKAETIFHFILEINVIIQAWLHNIQRLHKRITQDFY